MKSSLILLLILLPLGLTRAQPEQVKVRVTADTVVISNTAAWENCAARFEVETDVRGTSIRITETDTVREKMRCMCYFNIDARLTGLTAGRYSVTVLRQYLSKFNYPVDTLVQIGTASFEVVRGSGLPGAFIAEQSGCYQPTRVARPEPSTPRLEMSVFPNPVEVGTGGLTILFSVARNGGTTLELYDLLGRRVRLLASEELTPGSYQRRISSTLLPVGGVYLIVLTNGNLRRTLPLVCIASGHHFGGSLPAFSE